MHKFRFTISASLCTLALGGLVGEVFANNHIRDIQPITTLDQPSLELKSAFIAPDRLLVADLFNNGSQNQIDLHAFTAAPDGVMPLDSTVGLVTGDVFGLGDWCLGPDYAAIPFVNSNDGSFDLQVAGYLMSSGATAVMDVPDSASDRYTSADCSTLDNGTFILSAQNFDTGAIDYFSSSDQGLAWNLEASFSLTSDSIISPFSGGFRPTSGAIGNDVGTLVQGSSGEIVAAQVNPFSGSPIGSINVFNHLAKIGNGFLKECDGLTYLGHAFGLCNKGDAAWGGSINLSDGTLDTVQLNPVGIGATHSFQGVTVSAGIFGGQEQFHTFTDRHIVTPFDGTT